MEILQNSEDMLEAEQLRRNEELDEEYQLNCCSLCGRHLQFVRTYPATCGMCKSGKGIGLTPDSEPYKNYSFESDFKVTNSNNGKL